MQTFADEARGGEGEKEEEEEEKENEACLSRRLLVLALSLSRSQHTRRVVCSCVCTRSEVELSKRAVETRHAFVAAVNVVRRADDARREAKVKAREGNCKCAPSMMR